ncbi:hypothetical protein FYZ48_12280 [Gimesia chilikensis]|uniref:hypothetical protein n=1 Tax=Gimesia chilikensis TaxID=2605989 RepID=UPI0011F08BF1|nr:hypothetical protein [Gimesia chilikensis]KAA0138265.1 hypothetical protein FYZ48_12280 [Gimesia chilikensis]
MLKVLPALLLGLILGPFPLSAAQPVAARKPKPTPPPSQIKTAGELLQLPDSFLQQWGDSTVFRAREVQRQFSHLQQSHPQKASGKRMQKILQLNRRENMTRFYFNDGPNNRLNEKLIQLNAP